MSLLVSLPPNRNMVKFFLVTHSGMAMCEASSLVRCDWHTACSSRWCLLPYGDLEELASSQISKQYSGASFVEGTRSIVYKRTALVTISSNL
jgi:hypothetical protein